MHIDADFYLVNIMYLIDADFSFAPDVDVYFGWVDGQWMIKISLFS